MKSALNNLIVLAAMATSMDDSIYADPNKPTNKLRPENIDVSLPDLVVPKDCKAYYFTKTGTWTNTRKPGMPDIVWQCVARTNAKAEAKYKNWCTEQLRAGLMKAVNNAVGVINNANPVMQIPATFLIHISDEEFTSRYNDKSGSTIYYGDLATIEEIEKRAKLLNLK